MVQNFRFQQLPKLGPGGDATEPLEAMSTLSKAVKRRLEGSGLKIAFSSWESLKIPKDQSLGKADNNQHDLAQDIFGLICRYP